MSNIRLVTSPSEPAPLSVLSSLRGKTIVLTGVTGFLAKVWLSELLFRVPDVARVFVLARGRKGQSGRQRVIKLLETSPAFRPLRARHGEQYGAFVEEKIVVVEGDATTANFGLSEALLDEIDGVVHSAGLTDFNPDPNLAIDANIEGARNAALLAARCRGKTLLHVSTCFVAGDRDGMVREQLTFGVAPNGAPFSPDHELFALKSVLAEASTRQPERAAKARSEAAVTRAKALGWPNIYTYTKGLAEHCVWEIAEREGVRATLLRPSIVECAEHYPFAGWNEGLNTSAPIVWLVSTPLANLPLRAEYAFDVVPVDSVSRAMSVALAHSFSQPRFEPPTVLQVATSDHNRFTFHRAVDLTSFARARAPQNSDSWWQRLNVTALASRNGKLAPSETRSLENAAQAFRWGRDQLLTLAKQTKAPTPMLNKAARTLGGWSKTAQHVHQLLEAYEPFVWQKDYTFETSALRGLCAQLASDEQELFASQTHAIDWRKYWVEVQIPGLDLWSLPLMYGERIPDDIADLPVTALRVAAELALTRAPVKTMREAKVTRPGFSLDPRSPLTGQTRARIAHLDGGE